MAYVSRNYFVALLQLVSARVGSNVNMFKAAQVGRHLIFLRKRTFHRLLVSLEDEEQKLMFLCELF